MRNKHGLSIIERINNDIDIAESTIDKDQRRLLAYMALAEAELAIDFNLITRREWEELTQRAFAVS